jgi:flagellar hook protein FlgE
MSSVFSIALSSLQADSEAISTTGNNLANLNTTGYKNNSVNFRDLVAASLGGSSTGLGVSRPINQQDFSQGALSSSQSPWAVAIQGNGFFIAQQSNGQQVYTRDGNFALSRNGTLQTLTGENVQGWSATATGINSTVAPGNIILNTGGTIPPTPTANLSFNANLNSAGDPTTGSGNLSVPVQVIDSSGNQHTVTIDFTQSTTAGTWNYTVQIPSSDLASGTGTNTTLTSGSLSFGPNGTLTTASLAPITIPITGLADGASNMSIKWNLTNPDGTGAITQFAQNSGSSSLTQDGLIAGTLTALGFGDNGQIIAKYSNGQQKTVAQLALATFTNQSSLQDAGNNEFIVTGGTAPPDIGLSETGNRGHIVNGQLEGSNVNIATQFTNLIAFQQSYSASSKVITTADNMSQDLLQLIR